MTSLVPWNVYERGQTAAAKTDPVLAASKADAEQVAQELYGRPMDVDLQRKEEDMPTWNVYNDDGGRIGSVDADTKDDAQNLAQDSTGQYVDVDVARPTYEPNESDNRPENPRGF
jgi:hypothetical protein